MHKKRLVSQVQHKHEVDELMDLMVNNKPIDISQVQKYHSNINESINDAIENAHIAAQATRNNPALTEYYNTLFQRLNQISKSLEGMHLNNHI